MNKYQIASYLVSPSQPVSQMEQDFSCKTACERVLHQNVDMTRC